MSKKLNEESLFCNENIKEIRTEKLPYTAPLLNSLDLNETAGGSFNLQEKDFGPGVVKSA